MRILTFTLFGSNVSFMGLSHTAHTRGFNNLTNAHTHTRRSATQVKISPTNFIRFNAINAMELAAGNRRIVGGHNTTLTVQYCNPNCPGSEEEG